MFNNYSYQVNCGKGFNGPTSGQPLLATIQSWFAGSWKTPNPFGIGAYVEPFYLCFDTTTSETIQLNPTTGLNFPSTPATYAFDCTVYPPYPDNFNGATTSGTGNPYNGKCKVELNDWALRAIDLQYKDNAQSPSSNMAFYSTNAGDTRWNELVINATFGDTNSTGFPGSFLLSNNKNTGTWHNRTVGDTGQTLVDIFFKNFAQIPAIYRPNLKGNVIYDNTLQFFHSVIDEDGEVYMQMGHTLEVKFNKYTTDMDGMADTGITITTNGSSPYIPFHPGRPIPLPSRPMPPLNGPTKATPIKQLSSQVLVLNKLYPI